MRPPENVKLIESTLSTLWFEEDGIFCSVFHENALLTKESLQDSFNKILELTKGEKVCWLGEVTHVPGVDRETRDFASKETPKLIKALAIVTRSPISSMIANLYLGLKKPPFPAKLFTDEQKAREWLRHYL
ncbi:MAG TPA: STAS/SEC14 domain-containing protein [Bacteroidia bacterium]|jgi:hypothetical protein|nr:STAS/SEC14 domain-containing protein [Bacteroidia bacterium]